MENMINGEKKEKNTFGGGMPEKINGEESEGALQGQSEMSGSDEDPENVIIDMPKERKKTTLTGWQIFCRRLAFTFRKYVTTKKWFIYSLFVLSITWSVLKPVSLYLTDVYSDLALAIKFFNEGDRYWGTFTMVFFAAPFLIFAFMSFKHFFGNDNKLLIISIVIGYPSVLLYLAARSENEAKNAKIEKEKAETEAREAREAPMRPIPMPLYEGEAETEMERERREKEELERARREKEELVLLKEKEVKEKEKKVKEAEEEAQNLKERALYYRLLEILTESLPQLFLQLYIVGNRNQIPSSLLQISTIASSFWSVIHGMITGLLGRGMKRFQSTLKRKLLFTFLSLLWLALHIVSFLPALALFSSLKMHSHFAYALLLFYLIIHLICSMKASFMTKIKLCHVISIVLQLLFWFSSLYFASSWFVSIAPFIDNSTLSPITNVIWPEPPFILHGWVLPNNSNPFFNATNYPWAVCRESMSNSTSCLTEFAALTYSAIFCMSFILLGFHCILVLSWPWIDENVFYQRKEGLEIDRWKKLIDEADKLLPAEDDLKHQSCKLVKIVKGLELQVNVNPKLKRDLIMQFKLMDELHLLVRDPNIGEIEYLENVLIALIKKENKDAEVLLESDLVKILARVIEIRFPNLIRAVEREDLRGLITSLTRWMEPGKNPISVAAYQGLTNSLLQKLKLSLSLGTESESKSVEPGKWENFEECLKNWFEKAKDVDDVGDEGWEKLMEDILTLVERIIIISLVVRLWWNVPHLVGRLEKLPIAKVKEVLTKTLCEKMMNKLELFTIGRGGDFCLTSEREAHGLSKLKMVLEKFISNSNDSNGFNYDNQRDEQRGEQRQPQQCGTNEGAHILLDEEIQCVLKNTVEVINRLIAELREYSISHQISNASDSNFRSQNSKASDSDSDSETDSNSDSDSD